MFISYHAAVFFEKCVLDVLYKRQFIPTISPQLFMVLIVQIIFA